MKLDTNCGDKVLDQPLALTLALSLGLLATAADAETLILRGGRAIEGELLGYDAKAQEFRFKLKEGGVLTLRRTDVERIIFVDAPQVGDARPDDLREGWIPISGGFAYRDVSFVRQGDRLVYSGEVLNRSGRGYPMASFMITFYDQSRQVVRAERFTVLDFSPDATRRFKGEFSGGLVLVEGYRVRFAGER